MNITSLSRIQLPFRAGDKVVYARTHPTDDARFRCPLEKGKVYVVGSCLPCWDSYPVYGVSLISFGPTSADVEIQNTDTSIMWWFPYDRFVELEEYKATWTKAK